MKTTSVFCLCASLTFFACTLQATPLVVVSGGALSCEGIHQSPPANQIFLSSAPLRRKLAIVNHLQSAPYVTSCHKLSPHRRFIRTSRQPNQIIKGDLGAFAAQITKSYRAANATELHMIGHSYGGYDVVQVIDLLPADIFVNSLSTIDSISVNQCPPMRLYWTVTRNLWHLPIHPGCVSTPQDIEATGQKVRSRIGFWRNYFQRTSKSLASTALAPADENVQKSIGVAGSFKIKAHTYIELDAEIWSLDPSLFLNL